VDRGERSAEGFGELPHEAGDRGLREAELFGSAGYAAQPHARLEGEELGKHAVSKVSPQAGRSHVDSFALAKVSLTTPEASPATPGRTSARIDDVGR